MAFEDGISDFGNGLLSGAKNFFGGGSAEVDPNTGLSEQMRKQAMFQTFGNIGALLMAAGQKQMPAQRAQILAQLGSATSGPQEMMMKQAQIYQQNQQRLAQQKLLAVQTAQAQQNLAAQGKAAEAVSGMIGSLPPELQAAAKADPVGFLQAQRQAQLAQIYRNKTQTEQTYEMALRATGGNPELAAGIASGAIKAVPDGLGRTNYVNVATGKEITFGGTPAPAAPNPPPATGQQGMIPGSVAPPGPLPSNAQATLLAPPPQDPTQAIKGDVAYSSATGPAAVIRHAGGAVKNAWNSMFGGPDAQAAEPTRAADALDQLQQRSRNYLTADVPGRPTQKLRDQLDKQTVGTGLLDTVMSTDVASKSKLTQTRDMIREEIDRINNDIIGRPREHRPLDIEKAKQNLSQLQKLKRDYDTVLGSFDAPSQQPAAAPQSPRQGAQNPGGKASTGVQWKLVD